MMTGDKLSGMVSRLTPAYISWDKLAKAAGHTQFTPDTPTIADDQEWMLLGLCNFIDPEIWYPEQQGRSAWGQKKLAKQICRKCPVIDQCLEYALTHNEEWGIWGGTDPTERKKMKGDKSKLADAS